MSHGRVCAPQPEAVEAGAIALKKGGNAVDAAITCALVQTVVDPMMCGIAGFGSMQLYLPKKGHHGYIDFHTTAPGTATPDMWLDQIESQSRDGFGFIRAGAEECNGVDVADELPALDGFGCVGLGDGRVLGGDEVHHAVGDSRGGNRCDVHVDDPLG